MEKVVWSESGEKSAQIKHRLQAKTVQNSSKQMCGWILMWETTGDGLFHWRKRFYGLWTRILVKNIFMELFQLLSSQDVNWWITCGILWCFYQLFGLSFWRHPFRIHWWASDGMIKSDEETNSSTSWKSAFSANFSFWMNYSFKSIVSSC